MDDKETKEVKTEEAIKENQEKKTKDWLSIVVMVLLFAAIAVTWLIPVVHNKQQELFDTTEFSAVDKICELATLKCYYHDVAELEKTPGGLFKYGVAKYGYKKLWMEYDGIVQVGIDVNEVKVSSPDKDGVVQIYVPKAKILDVSAQIDSMKDPISDTGWFTSITTEEKAEAFAEAQAKMKEEAQSNGSILSQAQNNAKELLKQYVINVGKQMDKQYTIQWIDNPNEERKVGTNG